MGDDDIEDWDDFEEVILHGGKGINLNLFHP